LKKTDSPICNPKTVDSSAKNFIDADIQLPLLMMMPNPAMRLVVMAGENPYMNRLITMGTPVKSNLRLGYHGKGIFRPEYFRV